MLSSIILSCNLCTSNIRDAYNLLLTSAQDPTANTLAQLIINSMQTTSDNSILPIINAY